MKKVPSLFKRDYTGNRQVLDELVPGSEWVTQQEGVATLKIDGTCCMVQRGQLFKRFDRKLTKRAARHRKRHPRTTWTLEDFKPAPEGWLPCHQEPNTHTGHWPGWLEVSADKPEDMWHREAQQRAPLDDGTYELIGPKVQGNPYNLDAHELVRHGTPVEGVPTTFDALKSWLEDNLIEGIVWHHPDGRMVKIKRRDFGLAWPA